MPNVFLSGISPFSSIRSCAFAPAAMKAATFAPADAPATDVRQKRSSPRSVEKSRSSFRPGTETSPSKTSQAATCAMPRARHLRAPERWVSVSSGVLPAPSARGSALATSSIPDARIQNATWSRTHGGSMAPLVRHYSCQIVARKSLVGPLGIAIVGLPSRRLISQIRTT